jgi:hypothetical protein
LTGLVCALVGGVVVAAYGVRGIAGRYGARLEESERAGAEKFDTSRQAAWQELDSQRTRNEIRNQYWR